MSMNNAYGFLEVNGLVTGIHAADAMLKAANVQLTAQVRTNPALITLVVEGDIGSCRAAVDAGRMAAERMGGVVSEKIIGRPEPGLELFFRRTKTPEPIDAIVGFLTNTPSGKRLDQIALFMKLSEDDVLGYLEEAVTQGRLQKNHSRYMAA